jgi:osmotically-inducible protein OsmY
LIRAYVRSDEDLAEDARQMVAVLPEPMSTVQIDVTGAVVTLTGAVNTKEEARFVTRMVKSVEGMTSVNNQLVFGKSADRGAKR